MVYRLEPFNLSLRAAPDGKLSLVHQAGMRISCVHPLHLGHVLTKASFILQSAQHSPVHCCPRHHVGPLLSVAWWVVFTPSRGSLCPSSCPVPWGADLSPAGPGTRRRWEEEGEHSWSSTLVCPDSYNKSSTEWSYQPWTLSPPGPGV